MTLTESISVVASPGTQLAIPKIALAVREDLAAWRKLNVTAFLASGLAASRPDLIGQPYLDGSGGSYLPLFTLPVMVFAGDSVRLRRAFERAVDRGLRSAIFTVDMFDTGNDVDNRRAVREVEFGDLELAGFGFIADRKVADKVLKGMSLHS